MQDRQSIEIVLVHLGSGIPKILKANIGYINEIFGNVKLTVIVDDLDNQKHLVARQVNCWLYTTPVEVDLAFKDHQYSKQFRNGFWQTSTKRIFAFLQYCEMESHLQKIHIENDIHLFPNFPLNAFLNLQKLAWLGYNEDRDVGSVIFCPNADTASWLSSELLLKMFKNRNFTDMTLLRDISRQYPERVAKLPIAESPTSAIYATTVANIEKVINSENFDVFAGIFDAAPVGMWLTGQDPRNHRGKVLLHENHEDSFVQPNQIEFAMESKNLYILSESSVPIYNLHVHSKNRSIIAGEYRHLQKYVRIAKDKQAKNQFKISIFLSLLYSFLMKKISSPRSNFE